jgi:hypothetical protein
MELDHAEVSPDSKPSEDRVIDTVFVTESVRPS